MLFYGKIYVWPGELASFQSSQCLSNAANLRWWVSITLTFRSILYEYTNRLHSDNFPYTSWLWSTAVWVM